MVLHVTVLRKTRNADRILVGKSHRKLPLRKLRKRRETLWKLRK
jgi:hypothetical protein